MIPEVVSKSQITFKDQAWVDENAQHTDTQSSMWAFRRNPWYTARHLYGCWIRLCV